MDVWKHRAFITTESEMPEAGLCLMVSLGGGDEIRLFMATADQYRKFRNAFPPKACITNDGTRLHGAEADAHVDAVLAALEAKHEAESRETVEAAS